ncbi:MAG: hypothetical protein WDM96_14295 [Lacunisphaera sp.]
MSPTFGFVIPPVCALLYVFAALMLKRASALGVGPWRIGFLANWVMLFVFLPWGLLQPGATGPDAHEFLATGAERAAVPQRTDLHFPGAAKGRRVGDHARHGYEGAAGGPVQPRAARGRGFLAMGGSPRG